MVKYYICNFIKFFIAYIDATLTNKMKHAHFVPYHSGPYNISSIDYDKYNDNYNNIRL